MTARRAFVINRAVDVARRAHFFESLPAVFDTVEVVEAVDAAAPGFDPRASGRLYRGIWWESQTVKPGAFACFLSHAQAWQKIVDDGLDRAVIFEDDALVQPAIASALAEWPHEAHDHQTVRAACLNTIRQNRKPGRDVEHPGGEAYGLTRAGAERLLAWMEETGITFGVDWFLVASGLALSDLEGGDEVIDAARHLRSVVGERPLHCVVISGRPCVRHVGARLGGSAINHRNRKHKNSETTVGKSGGI